MQQIFSQLRAQQQIQDQIAQGASLQAVLDAICAYLEEQIPDALCSVMLLDPSEQTLNLIASVSLPAAYTQAMHHIPVAEGMGACGNTAWSKEATVVYDILTAPGWGKVRALAEENDLRACWSYPLISSEQALLGTFATYYRQPRRPSKTDIKRIARAAGLASLAIERHQDRARLRDYEARLAYFASHDRLTSLPNRAVLEDRLRHDFDLARRHQRLLSLMFIDLDGFKPINDSLGHQVGDAILTAAAERIQRVLQPSDTLSRFNADEFVLLLPNLEDEDQTQALAEQILHHLALPYLLEPEALHLTASIGIATNHDPAQDALELIQFADQAMTRAKQQGRNTFEWYTHDISERLNQRVSLRRELQEAIDAEKLELHYQPLVCAQTLEVISLEALLRWNHPDKGYISPADFIPLAEETGQIIPLSNWVIKQACLDSLDLEKQLHKLYPIAVNISPLQFRRSSFLDHLFASLEEFQRPTQALELELTEGILMDNPDTAIRLLKLLRLAGVKVAIDDFGTGFSSLSYLKRLPISKIKIDRSFVREVTHSSADAAIIQGVISMAHHMQLQVVAEGIEKPEQQAFLQQSGCDLLQGFLFARPMSKPALLEFLQTAKAVEKNFLEP
ncbi:putative bifunctional diguanylate cyclase/phosphodiesterase [Nitrincola tapanii]|uniref:cyclic-guanylate-specific phosphodiesterase n=1 Tax=Nitrincola tapanii TaxID=1708751 RepID=A0A5A9W507_9GAMM|nr:EAL domain-containing protein [Nitrincola tapanii]KAA0874651.1 EAL domain-containing protein [Nitrincola tapanii]